MLYAEASNQNTIFFLKIELIHSLVIIEIFSLSQKKTFHKQHHFYRKILVRYCIECAHHKIHHQHEAVPLYLLMQYLSLYLSEPNLVVETLSIIIFTSESVLRYSSVPSVEGAQTIICSRFSIFLILLILLLILKVEDHF